MTGTWAFTQHSCLQLDRLGFSPPARSGRYPPARLPKEVTEVQSALVSSPLFGGPWQWAAKPCRVWHQGRRISSGTVAWAYSARCTRTPACSGTGPPRT